MMQNLTDRKKDFRVSAVLDTTRADGRGHGRRSVDILTECGYPLTADERTAIGRHHSHSPEAQACRLRSFLKTADCHSARTWTPARPC